MRRIPISLTLAALLSATAAYPCGFHNYTPQPTLVDRLLASDHIVLARADANNPFRFRAVEALEGEVDHVDIPQLVDTSTRRRFATDPSAHVLFAREGAYGPWERVAYVDAAMATVLDQVMPRLEAWEFGDDEDRFGLFAALLGHPDKRIHDLALSELDLADYGLLRTLPLTIDTARLTAVIGDPQETNLAPIRILLLGFSDDPVIGGNLEKGVAQRAALGGGVLGAFATAMIQSGGPKAAVSIAQTYLADTSLPLDNREIFAEALAIHSQTGNAEMRAAITPAVASALRDDPRLAPAVARQFGVRSDWSQHEALAEILQMQALPTIADTLLVSQYVSLALQTAASPGN